MLNRAKRWLNPSPDTVGALRLGFAAAYIGVVGTLVVYTNYVSPCSDQWPHSRQWAMIGLLALMLFVERFELTRDPQPIPRHLAIGLLIVRAALVQGVVALDCTKLGIILYPMVPFAAFFVLGVDISNLMGIGYWLWVVSRAWRFDSDGLRTNFDSLTVVVVYTLLLIFMQVIARHIDRDQRSRQRMQQLLDELEASHLQLQGYADRVAELAAAAERNRLARDIHDSLGHYLTAISIQLEKAQVYRARSPEQADQAIRDARQTARAALQDVRQSVSALRASDDKFSLKKSLADLAGRMDRDTLEIEYRLEGDETDYAGPVLTTLYRVAQEGLTNVQKHARASHVTLDVRLGDTEAWLTLRDDGAGFDTNTLTDLASSPEHSFGIQGLQERLELVRGQMRITSDPSRGTELIVTVPKHPAQLAAV
ncbi:MAG: sensor histidine kinase [Chloroflexi bacterium]|nr:sensor histidine kinase [Chloroflexota bacterium]